MRNKLIFIQNNYPLLWEDLQRFLPANFFSNPEKCSLKSIRIYNNIISEYFLRTGDFASNYKLQFIVAIAA